MNWGEKFFGKKFGIKDIFFIQVTIDENSVRIFRPAPFLFSQQKI